MAEIWRRSQVDGDYEVSNLGQVRSIDRIVTSKSSRRASQYSRAFTGKMLKPFLSKSTGYLQVNLSNKTRMSVHRLVALEFCQPSSEGLVVNHKNGNRQDNRAENLEWVTSAENNLHAFRVLSRRPSSLNVFGGDHPTAKPVTGVCLSTGIARHYRSGMEAQADGFSGTAISHCCAGRQKTHKGHRWQFASPDYWGAAA